MKFLLLISLLSVNTFPHGDHSIPGAIPPAPNGGSLGEAKHDHGKSHKHDHKKASEIEVFFEAVYKNKLLNIHFLELDPKTNKLFLEHDFADFKDLKLEIKDARKKKIITKKHMIDSKKITVDMTGERARRLLIKISGNFKGAKFDSEFQVERK